MLLIFSSLKRRLKSPKCVSKRISADKEEITALNEGLILFRENKEKKRYNCKNQASSAVTIGHNWMNKNKPHSTIKAHSNDKQFRLTKRVASSGK